jgi:5-methylcytosine-specific restriction endonuclease McrA
MKKRYISEKIRQKIIEQANGLCEYCLQSNLFSFTPHQIDHIISLKHGGKTELENLAYACFGCNNAKSSDVGTVLLPERIFIRLFNPRTDNWNDHFEIYLGKFYAKTQIGEATIKVLNLNVTERIMERNDE